MSGINQARYTSKLQINYIFWWQRDQHPKFADDIDLITGINKLTNRLIEDSKEYGMEVNKEKNKIMVNIENENASNFMDGMLVEDIILASVSVKY